MEEILQKASDSYQHLERQCAFCWSRPLLIKRCCTSAKRLAEIWFKCRNAQGLFSGLAAHSILPLEKPLTAAFGLILGILGHAVGWPIPRGGSQKIADALAAYLHELRK